MIKNILAIILILISSPASFAVEVQPMAPFTKDDKVLIMAPHPDDETIATAGIIQRAKKGGAAVKIMCFTNGDHNELSFIVYEKRIPLQSGEFIHMGETRRNETIAAMKSLGLERADLVFLGYPDFGTMEILTKYWGDTKPFLSFLTKQSKVPYSDCLSPGAPYVGESILNDIEKVLIDFRPTKIFVSSPVDSNRDHRALYLFTHIALWDLKGRINDPEIYPYIIHVISWPAPRGYHPELGLDVPDELEDNPVSWHKLAMSDEEVSEKHDAIAFYKSQLEYAPSYLFTFARKNELFGEYYPIKLKDRRTNETDWQQTILPSLAEDKESARSHIKGLAYAEKNGEFLVRMSLNVKISVDFEIAVSLLGYKQDRDFAAMPKVGINIGAGGMRIKEKKQSIFIKDIRLDYQNDSLVLKIPLKVLRDPSRILISVNAHKTELPFDETAWRIIELE
jgi:LmbE family N-acetylglucosaminyl deacetylase